MTPPALTDVELAELQAKAERATPGPWRNGSVEKYNVFVECRDPESLGMERVLFKMNTHFSYEADATFIAAANPATVLRLLAIVKAVDRWRDQWCPCDSTHCESQPTKREDLNLLDALDSLRAGRGR